MRERRKCLAKPATGTAKYSHGMTSGLKSRIGLPEQTIRDLNHAVSHSIAKKTWLSYRTAERMLAKFMRENGQSLSLPISEVVTLGFVHWLAYKRGLKASTINGYLAGVRNLHIMKGLPEPKIRTDLVKMVIEGRKNIDAINRLSVGKKERQPVSLDLMKLLKARIYGMQAAVQDKLTAWLVCTLALHAACRGGELLCKTEESFDPAVELLREDVQMKVIISERKTSESLQLRLKMPKESKDNRATIVDVFETGSEICPVKAFKKWQKFTGGAGTKEPAFLWSNGKPVTAKAMNKLLKEVLDPVLSDHQISMHSFRTGAASLMGELGYSDTEIQAVGRWSSRAFENYIKLGRSKRIAVLRKMEKQRAWL